MVQASWFHNVGGTKVKHRQGLSSLPPRLRALGVIKVFVAISIVRLLRKERRVADQ